jgi:hypothetical protein
MKVPPQPSEALLSLKALLLHSIAYKGKAFAVGRPCPKSKHKTELKTRFIKQII